MANGCPINNTIKAWSAPWRPICAAGISQIEVVVANNSQVVTQAKTADCGLSAINAEIYTMGINAKIPKKMVRLGSSNAVLSMYNNARVSKTDTVRIITAQAILLL